MIQSLLFTVSGFEFPFSNYGFFFLVILRRYLLFGSFNVSILMQILWNLNLTTWSCVF